MKKIIKYFLIPLGLLVVMAGCSNEGDSEQITDTTESDKPQIVTSIFPVYEITQAIAGDTADVSLMVGPNDDPHHYEPSAQAVAAVNEADVFVYSSEVMEFWAESLLDVVENENMRIIELADGLDLSTAEAHNHDDHNHDEHNHGDHDHGGMDPHFWLDPVAVDSQLSLITGALTAVNPANEAVYEENAEAFSDELESLHTQYEQAFNEATERTFLVQHQAFGHLAKRYNLEQVAVSGLTTEVEPDPQQLAEIVDFVNAQDIPVVYYQSGENSAIAQTIADETGTDIAVLYDLESEPADLSGDNLYLEAMYENLEQLQLSIQ